MDERLIRNSETQSLKFGNQFIDEDKMADNSDFIATKLHNNDFTLRLCRRQDYYAQKTICLAVTICV